MRAERAAKKAAELPQGISIPVDEFSDDSDVQSAEEDSDGHLLSSDSAESDVSDDETNVVDDDAGFEIVRRARGKRKVEVDDSSSADRQDKRSRIEDDDGDDFEGGSSFFTCIDRFAFLITCVFKVQISGG